MMKLMEEMSIGGFLHEDFNKILGWVIEILEEIKEISKIKRRKMEAMGACFQLKRKRNKLTGVSFPI